MGWSQTICTQSSTSWHAGRTACKAAAPSGLVQGLLETLLNLEQGKLIRTQVDVEDHCNLSHLHAQQRHKYRKAAHAFASRIQYHRTQAAMTALSTPRALACQGGKAAPSRLDQKK